LLKKTTFEQKKLTLFCCFVALAAQVLALNIKLRQALSVETPNVANALVEIAALDALPLTKEIVVAQLAAISECISTLKRVSSRIFTVFPVFSCLPHTVD
jgi:hypothetical protein